MNYAKFKDRLERANDIAKSTYKLKSGYRNTNSIYSNLSQNELRKNYNFSNKYSGVNTFVQYRTFLAARRYNTFMFFSLLWKIFAVLTPLIIVSVILSGDNFNFDFFQFTNRFANLNINFSKPLLDLLKSSNETISKFAWNTSAEGFGGFISNIANAIGGIGVRIGQFLTLIGLIFTFIFDFFSNVFAFLGALIPSLSY